MIVAAGHQVALSSNPLEGVEFGVLIFASGLCYGQILEEN